MTRHKLGRTAPHDPATHPRIALRDLLGATYPPAPASVDYVSDITDWPMYMNGPDPSNPPQIPDGIGDCTFAAPGHMIESWTRYAGGKAVEVTNQDLLAGYEKVTGYRLGDEATDQGANMQDVLSYWRKTGIGGHKILAFAEVDLKSNAEVNAALALFGHLYVGVNLPANAEDQFDADQPWSVETDDGGNAGGHAICVGAFSPGRYVGITWGRAQEILAEWLARYAEECWVVVTQEWIEANGDNPESISTAVLGEAFEAITGEANPFPIQPTPEPPAPTPGPAPTPAPVDDADRALAAAAGTWPHRPHRGETREVAEGLLTWLAAKGL